MSPRPLLAVLSLGLTGTLGWAVLVMPHPEISLPAQVAARLPESGVTHPVTAVLLAFRAYDTLLEVAVLLAAALCAYAVSVGARLLDEPEPPRAEVQLALVRAIAPVVVLFACYLLWAGSSQPGGAFQAGAMLGACGVLLRLSGWMPPGILWRASWLTLIASGMLFFLAVSLLSLLAGAAWLGYPPRVASYAILAIETILTLAIGATLIALYGLSTDIQASHAAR